MKKTFGIALITCLSIFACSKSNINSDWKNDVSNYGFNGNVKSVKSELFDLIAEKDTFRIGEKINSLSFDRNSLLEFNELGNLTSSKEFYSNGKISDEVVYTYDEQNRLIKRKEIDNYGKGSFYDNEFKYNSKDSISEWIISNDDFKRFHKIKRDNKNRPVKQTIIQNDTVFGVFSVVYDQDKIIAENEYKYDNKPVRLLTRKFNEQNLKEKEEVTEYKTWDTLNYENHYFYNSKQELILEKRFIENDTLYEEIKNTYHPNGKLKESISTPKGSSYFVITSQKFNEKGHLIKHSRIPNDEKEKEIWEYQYKYDSKGNWIEKINYKDKIPLRIVKREIEYY